MLVSRTTFMVIKSHQWVYTFLNLMREMKAAIVGELNVHEKGNTQWTLDKQFYKLDVIHIDAELRLLKCFPLMGHVYEVTV